MNLYWTREELKKWSFFIFIGTVLVYSARSALPVVSGTGLSKLSKHVPCGGKWFLPFLTSQKVQIRNKKRYKFDFLTENRFKPRSPLRTWPKNGHQNEIEKLKKVLVRDEFGWDNNELGKVMGSFSYGYMMSQIIGGFLADKFGGAIVMTFCGVIWSILTYLTSTLI